MRREPPAGLDEGLPGAEAAVRVARRQRTNGSPNGLAILSQVL